MTGQYKSGIGFEGGDPRLAMSRALMQQGASTAPVQSPLEGIARALQGGLGGYLGGQAKRGQQEGMAAALAALGDQSMDPNARMAAATGAYAKANPGGDNPLESMQLSAMMQALMPKPAASPLGKLYQDMKDLPSDSPVRKMFETNMAKDAGDPTYLQRAAGAGAQGAADVKLAMEPQQIAANAAPTAAAEALKINTTAGPQAQAAAMKAGAENPALIQRAGGEASARSAVELRNAGPIAAARAAGTNAGTGGFPKENSLRDEFTKLTGDFRTVQDAYNKIGEAAKKPSGAGDMSLLYSYVKLLDPGSVVRESEFATAAASGSLGERMQGLVQRVVSGERLPESLRKDFIDQAGGIYKAQKVGYDNVTKQYEALAKNYSVNPANVTTRFDTPPAGAQGEVMPANASQSGGMKVFRTPEEMLAAKLPSGAPFLTGRKTPTGADEIGYAP